MRADAPHAGVHRPVRAAPREHEQVGAFLVVDLEVGHVDAGDLLRAQLRHQVVVLGVVRDVARLVRLLEAADPMLEPGRAGNRPRPRERVRVALVGQERLAVRASRTRPSIGSSAPTSGICHGSAPLAR